MEYKPNKYQQAILDFVENGKGNALVEARAGCGKTSTLIMLADLITQKLDEKCLFLAFNKHIAEEVRQKLEDKIAKKQVEVATVNSLGSSFISSWLAVKNDFQFDTYTIKLDETKMYKICREIVERELFQNASNIFSIDDEELKDIIHAFKTLCDLARTTYIPYKDPEAVERLIQRHNVFLNVNTRDIDFAKFVGEAIDKDVEIFEKPIYSSKQDKYVYTIDYADQIFLPINRGMWAPGKVKTFGNAFILCDEAQDLSNAQQRLLQKCTNSKNKPRYIFVADEQQAIYGFNGADTHSVEHIKEKFALEYFPLSICYRCPKSHIKLIQSIVKDIETYPEAPEGEVHVITNAQIPELAQKGDYIIARKNKDLVAIMVEILKRGKSIYIKNEDLVSTTVTNIRKLKCETISELAEKLESLHTAFKAQQADPAKRVSGSAISNDAIDIYDTISILLEKYQEDSENESVSAFITYIEKMLNTKLSEENVVLSSVHGVKGGESKRVFIINYDNFPYRDERNSADQNQQERNLQYIAISRSKDTMYLCNK